MKQNKENIRLFVLVGVVLFALSAFTLRLMEFQLVDGKEYLEKAHQGITYEQTVKAARGEILDRNGSPFSYNKLGYNVLLDRALMPSGINNQEILKIVRIVEQLGEEWQGYLPITNEAPYQFTDDESEVDKLKNTLEIAEYATSEDAIYRLKERYKIQDFTDEESRKLMGIRYQMERQGFSMSTPYLLAENVTLETAIYLRQTSNDYVGVDIQESPMRDYQDGTLAPHIIGRVGQIFADELEDYLAKGYARDQIVGKDGIEKLYEDELRGKDGKRIVTLNNKHEVVDIETSQPPIPGNSVVLTLDKRLQEVALKAMEQQIAYLNATAPPSEGKEADSGAVAAIDIKTGEVLVLASYPGYDISSMSADYNSLISDPLNPLFNRALQGQYTPGSIFKPVVALASLNEGIVTPQTTINCQRVYSFSSTYNPTCLGTHGPFTVKDALRRSCNVYFYDCGKNLGIPRINEYAKMMGLGVPTGIELSERMGTLSNPESKNPGDALQAGIGQMGNAFTPLQLAQYTANIARKGTILKSTIIHSIDSYNFENPKLQHQPEILSEAPIKDEYFEEVIRGMVEASQPGGTAAATFGAYPLLVASKTGTPQTHDLPNSTFIAFAPADDPQIAIAVIIEKGWHGYTGAPVAKAIFDAVFFPKQEFSTLTDNNTLLP